MRAVAVFVAVCAIACGAPATALASKVSAPRLYVPSAILVTSDGAVLWSKNADAPRRIASTTKMLTALVVRDHASLDQTITIAPRAEMVDGGDIGLKAGQHYTVRQLLDVMLVHSANGAAEALAIGIGGTEQNFVKLMDEKAASLGLTHTRPADPHGLSPKGVSTAADLAVIARHLMADPVLRDIVSEKKTSQRIGTGYYYSTDRMLYSYRGIEGIKTGYTDPAGYCFAGAAKRDGIELFGIVLGAEAPNDRFTQMSKLLDWGFANVSEQEVVSREQTMGAVQVEDGNGAAVTVHAANEVVMPLVGESRSGVVTQVSLPSTVSAPVSAGQKLGEVTVSCGDNVVASVPLVCDCAVARSANAPARNSGPLAQGPVNSGGLWRELALVWADLGHALGI